MNYGNKVNVNYEMSCSDMVLTWQHECAYGCNIIFETHKSTIEMMGKHQQGGHKLLPSMKTYIN